MAIYSRQHDVPLLGLTSRSILWMRAMIDAARFWPNQTFVSDGIPQVTKAPENVDLTPIYAVLFEQYLR